MKKIFFLCTLFFLSLFSQAQVVTDNSNTVEYYIQNVLLGSGVSVSNITINGNPANVNEPMVGEFTDASSSIGLPNGLILGSGDIDLASQNNTSGSSSLGGGGNSGQDPDLSVIATNTLYDQTIVEIFKQVPNECRKTVGKWSINCNNCSNHQILPKECWKTVEPNSKMAEHL